LAVAGDLVDVVMPSFPTGWDPAMRQHWKWPGDRVEKDEVVCEIQTDVARVQIPSPAAGILEEWLYRPNEFIYVDGKWGEQVIAKIRTADTEARVGSSINAEEALGTTINQSYIVIFLAMVGATFMVYYGAGVVMKRINQREFQIIKDDQVTEC